MPFRKDLVRVIVLNPRSDEIVPARNELTGIAEGSGQIRGISR